MHFNTISYIDLSFHIIWFIQDYPTLFTKVTKVNSKLHNIENYLKNNFKRLETLNKISYNF